MSLKSKVMEYVAPTTEVALKALDETVTIQSLSAQQAAQFADMTTGPERTRSQWLDIMIAVITWAVVDKDTRKPIFDGADRPSIAALPLQAVQEIFTAIAEFSGATQEAVEDIEKNSPPAPTDNLSSN